MASMLKAAKGALLAYYAFVIVFPFLVFAQGAGLPSAIVPCDGVNCTVCDLATLAQNIINVGVFIFVFYAAAMFSFAGFLYLTSAAKPDQTSTARSILQNVTLGLIVLLSAWLIIDTIMKSLLGGDFGPWNNVCQFLTP
jgi:hypothetical protein